MIIVTTTANYEMLCIRIRADCFANANGRFKLDKTQNEGYSKKACWEVIQ
jgi:hypothetical protein